MCAKKKKFIIQTTMFCCASYTTISGVCDAERGGVKNACLRFGRSDKHPDKKLKKNK